MRVRMTRRNANRESKVSSIAMRHSPASPSTARILARLPASAHFSASVRSSSRAASKAFRQGKLSPVGNSAAAKSAAAVVGVASAVPSLRA
eukprot:1909701-Pleurochrysis_carterae.AAC.1